MDATFFESSAALRTWLERNYAVCQELWVGFYKKASGRPSITWPEAVDEALCFGWIDGLRKTIDDASYCIRFTPRRPGSTWSVVNLGRIAELTAEGRMRQAGLEAFAQRSEAKTGIYSHEQREDAELDPAALDLFRASAPAWAFFQAQPVSYRRAAIWWVVSAKQSATRRRRLATLIDDSAQGRTIKPLTRRPAKPGA